MYKRLLATAPIAFGVTFGLLFLMHALIESGQQAFVPASDRPTLTLVRPREEQPLERLVDPPVRPDPPVSPPPAIPPVDGLEPDGRGYVPVTAAAPGPIGRTVSVGPAPTDGPLVAIVRVAPEYPMSLSARGIEGYATVEFDVTETGTVTEIRMLDATHPAFAKPAVRAAGRFKYRPRIIDGQPVPTRNIQYRFRFVLERA